MFNPKLIAMYLPQYHATPDNDLWWGKGFTEWTNCARAKPLFKGHQQPHVPGELGFYNLEMEKARQAQADLAKKYGIYGFCYYYYRFEKGRNELDFPIKEILRLKKPDFPFMICWANQSWHKKFWRYDGSSENQILVEQKYNGIPDYIDFFYEVLSYFRDKRYIKIHDKPAFMIHKPKEFPDIRSFIATWQQLAQKEGLRGIYFIGYSNGHIDSGDYVKNKIRIKLNVLDDYKDIIALGFNAVTVNRQYFCRWGKSFISRGISFLKRKICKYPFVVPYAAAIKTMIGSEDKIDTIYPTILPNWDHTPRSGCAGEVFVGSTPELFKKLLIRTYQNIAEKETEDQIIFIKAWNEWGEGNYLEPDLEWGRGYLEAIKMSLEEFAHTPPVASSSDRRK